MPEENPPENYEALVAQLTGRYDSLSRRLQQISRFVLQNPDLVALATIKELATNARVPPSALVRLAQNLGYAGFSDMQDVFKDHMRAEKPGFSDRLRTLRNELRAGTPQTGNAASISENIALNDIVALEKLMEKTPAGRLNDASRILAKAKTVWVIGSFRSYPVAYYLYYALTILHREAHLLDDPGGLSAEKARTFSRADALLAVMLPPYPDDVVAIGRRAVEAHTPIVTLTDSLLNPLSSISEILLETPGGDKRFSHSLAAPMSLAHMLGLSLAERLDGKDSSMGELGEAFSW